MKLKNELKRKIQNLIDLKGEDIDNLCSDYEDTIGTLEERNTSLSSELQDKQEELEKHEFEHTIDTGLDKIHFKLDQGNLHDTEVMEALKSCYEKGIRPLFIAGVLEGLSKNQDVQNIS